MLAVGIGVLAVEGSELVAIGWEKKSVAVAIRVFCGEAHSELVKPGLVLVALLIEWEAEDQKWQWVVTSSAGRQMDCVRGKWPAGGDGE